MHICLERTAKLMQFLDNGYEISVKNQSIYSNYTALEYIAKKDNIENTNLCLITSELD